MQASQAMNETRLPRAVLRRSELIQARIDAREPKTDAAVPEAPETPVEAAQPAHPVDTDILTSAEAANNNDPAYWKQRFRATQGILAAERESRKAQVGEFNRRLTEMQEQLAQRQAATPAEPTDLGKYFTPEQVEDMGEDVCRAHVSAIEKNVREQLSMLVEKEIKPLRQEREQQQAAELEDRKAQFLDKLSELVPDYEDINASEDFLAWLAQVNDDGILRQEVLNTHVSKWNAAATARVFEGFKKTRRAPLPPVSPHGSAAGPSGEPPARGAVSGGRAPDDREVREFFKRAAIGRVSAAERVEFEARMKLRTGR